MKISAGGTWSIAAILLLGALVLLPGIEEPGLFDHEARYAEVARQMYTSGDWVTPRFNGTVFLNKPPLVYWLTAAAFYAVGINERARAWASTVGISLIAVTYLLGRAVGGRRVGLLAALVLVSSAGFFIEGRMIRTDVILTLLLAAAFLGFVRASTATDARVRSLWFLGGTAALAVSFLAKGLVGPVLAGLVILGVVVCCGLPFSGRETPWLAAFAIVLAVVLPWHVVVGLRNQHFWWDYVVNQHFLFFFDHKLPRDSEPDPVWLLWGGLFARTFPWCVFLPFAAVHGLRTFVRSRAPADGLAITWLLGVLGFFTAAPSRLEHYAIPALPAAALLVARWWADVVDRARRPPLGALVVLIALAGASLAAISILPVVLDTRTSTQRFPELVSLVPAVCGLTAAGALSAAAALAVGRGRIAPVALAATGLAILPFIHAAQRIIQPEWSWKLLGTQLHRLAEDDVQVVFAASGEYQRCAGLIFYSGVPLTVLLPDGYVPPPYLNVGDTTPFIDRTAFLKRWVTNRRILLVIDPDRGEAPEQLVPGAVDVVGRSGDRLILANRGYRQSLDLFANREALPSGLASPRGHSLPPAGSARPDQRRVDAAPPRT